MHTQPPTTKPQGGYIRRNYHANCATEPQFPFQPNIGVDRYWAPPEFYPSNGECGYGEPDSPRPDATTLRGVGAAASTSGFTLTSALAATRGAGGEAGTWRLGGKGQGQQQQQQPLLHRVPRQDDGVFVRLAEDDLVRRERNLAALTMVGSWVC